MKEERNSIISPRAAILAVVATFVLAQFSVIVLFLLFGFEVTLAFSELLLIIVPLGYMLYKKVNIRSYIGLDAKPLKILLGLALGGLVFLLNILISVLLYTLFGPSAAIEESNAKIIETSTSPSGLIAVITALSLAGICEEFTFRGFLQNAINSRYSFAVALFVSSLAFGLFHFDPQGIYTLSAFLIGLVLGLIYHRWQSYVVSAVVHSTVNLIAFALIFLIQV
ncbi:CPBP family intramembrane metalloprotease [Candidatus Bathyarchaeota archaeon]|nr:CPBP family intramembrane metalloprotease [Candidatus Bathyarchaeota archaeon]